MSTRNNRPLGIVFMIFWIVVGFAPSSSAQVELEGFCADLPRPAYSAFEKHQTSNEWFEVYEVEPNIWAIYEPFQWQEVISYLIVGTDSALLFDTGNGLGDIRAIVDQLTKKPVFSGLATASTKGLSGYMVLPRFNGPFEAAISVSGLVYNALGTAQ